MDAQAAARVGKLDEVLRGLPREYQNRQRLRSDVAELLRSCSTLQPSLSSFTGNGRSVTLFYLSGVLPISFRGATYNIPVTVYFDPPYPNSAPRCFVTPTRDMAIKPNHANVDKGGMVYAPCLSSWSASSSSLQNVVATLTSIFSQAPPVHSTATAPSSHATGYSSAAVASSTTAGYDQPSRVPVVQAQIVGPAQQPVVAQVVRLTESPKEAAVRSVTALARQRWPVVLKPVVDEANKQLRKKMELEQHALKVEDELRSLKESGEKNARHEAELREMEAELRRSVEALQVEEPDSDTLLAGMEPDAVQVLDDLAEEMALEEFLVALDDLLAGGQISIDDFMREVRDVGRRQFMVRLQRQKAAAVAVGATASGAVQAPAAAGRVLVAA
eukprot:TRINITY_DN63908_c0_g1_i1.p1 TRINITY_DN63908_c0_g1~~TRINITY_DN63908_c0_g1_i1.p1  ORF type:complete len:387 (+),score=79.74 TRINITY_DN63908_c0_g1_i1:67-1227(+)